MSTLNTLREVYCNPSNVKDFNHAQWNQLIKEGYATRMLARLHYLLEKAQVINIVPESLLWHFISASRFAIAHQRDMLIEVNYVNQAFKISGHSPIYLKGIAYLIAGDEAAVGRVFSDLDVYINKDNLSTVERFLHWKGWSAGDVDEYDEQYYRKWMHEIPALTHKTRGSTLDVHHNLLPLTSKIKINAKELEKNALVDLKVLAPEDRVIHSIVHLFLESEFEKGMRDMTDLDLLIRQYQQEHEDFALVIVNRSLTLGVDLMVFYALRYLKMYLNTPIDNQQLEKLDVHLKNKIRIKVMDALFENVLFNPLSLDRSLSNKFAHSLMFIRGHWLRMPLHLLVPHLFHKAFVTPFSQWKKKK